MCAVTLTILPSCKHELPTVQYCPEAGNSVETYKQKCQLGIKTPPPPTCTESLGWMIFKRLEAPVKCEGCKMWLTMNGKQTYGGMIEDQVKTDIKKEEDVEPLTRSTKRVKVEEKKAGEDGADGGGNDGEDGDNKPRKLNEEELGRLYGSLSRVFGTTSR